MKPSSIHVSPTPVQPLTSSAACLSLRLLLPSSHSHVLLIPLTLILLLVLIFSSFLLLSHHPSFLSNFSMFLFWSSPFSFLRKILSIQFLFAKFSCAWHCRDSQADASVNPASLTRNLSCTFSCFFHSRGWLIAKSKKRTVVKEALEI